MKRVLLMLVGVCLLAAVASAAPFTFTYTANIAIPGSGTIGPAAAYPIPIYVIGLPTSYYLVQFSVSGLSHTWADDLEFALASPSGTIIHLVNDAGAGNDYVNDTLTFNMYGQTIPDSGPLATGYVVPSVYGTWSGGVIVPNTTTMSTFLTETGTANHGTWNFYAFDDEALDVGQFTQIQLYFDNVNPIPEPGTYGLMGLGLAGLAMISRRRKV